MSRVMQAWEQVLRDAVSSDYDEQQHAVFQIGLVLGRHNPQFKPVSDMDEEGLSRELLRLTLNEKRQGDAIAYLITLVRNEPRKADVFLFALSNAQPKLLVESLFATLAAVGKTFGIDGAFQALMLLDNVIKQAPDIVRLAAQKHDITPLLDTWAESDDDTLADKADLTLNRIERLLEN